jgi:membrane protease YdiL (CAAX protease family)
MNRLEKVLLTFGLFGAYVLWCALVVQIPKTSFLYVLVFAPVIEELVFRYAILKMTLDHLHLRKNVYLVAIVVSFIFGLVHWHQNMFLVQGFLGFLLSFLYIKTRSYWLCVLFHAGWNAMIYFGLFNLLF